MDVLHSFTVFLTLLACVRPDAPAPPAVKASAQVSGGKPSLFTGENVQLTCSLPDSPSSRWTYRWFQDGTLVASSQVLVLNQARIQHSGKYTCEGERRISAFPYSIKSQSSDPVTVHVNGGWILLQAPHEPLIIEEAMTLTCRIRGNPVVSEVVFYRDEFVVKKQKMKDLVFPSVKVEDSGSYSCRATWIEDFEYHSAMSLPVLVEVFDKVNPPLLEFSTGEATAIVNSGEQVVLRCITQINVKEPGLSLDYYFIRDGEYLGRSSTKDTFVIPAASEEDTGFYRCKVRVRSLNLERLSNQAELQVRPRAFS